MNQPHICGSSTTEITIKHRNGRETTVWTERDRLPAWWLRELVNEIVGAKQEPIGLPAILRHFEHRFAVRN